MVKCGLNATRIGKPIIAAWFVTDMATVIALSLILTTPNLWFPLARPSPR